MNDSISNILSMFDFPTVETASNDTSETPIESNTVLEENPSTTEVQISENDFESILNDFGVPSTVQGVITPIPSSEHIDEVILVEDEEEEGEEESSTENTSSESNIEEQSELLQENSPTFSIDDSTSRFSGTDWYSNIQKTKVIIAGVGGIGSNLAYQVARLHPMKIVLYDDDVVETANMSGQFFSKEDMDKFKVDAIVQKLDEYTTSTNAFGINEKFTSYSEASDIMMCGFDSMTARRIYFDAWEKYVLSKNEEERKNCLFLDGRLSIDTLQVFAITGDDYYNMNKYREQFLFSDSEADETICSLKQTTYLACMIASIMTNIFINFVANFTGQMPYCVPFFTEYDAQNMLFKLEI